jgi:hypothetical protein
MNWEDGEVFILKELRQVAATRTERRLYDQVDSWTRGRFLVPNPARSLRTGLRGNLRVGVLADRLLLRITYDLAICTRPPLAGQQCAAY